jgi:hypothetical protein
VFSYPETQADADGTIRRLMNFQLTFQLNLPKAGQTKKTSTLDGHKVETYMIQK